MVLSEVIKQLEAEGYDVPDGRIHYAIRRGYVDRPRLNGALAFDFQERHVEQIKNYLDNPPKRGPKPQVATS